MCITKWRAVMYRDILRRKNELDMEKQIRVVSDSEVLVKQIMRQYQNYEEENSYDEK